jgi:tRNA threonylcarbamoyladenosine dehydratase
MDKHTPAGGAPEAASHRPAVPRRFDRLARLLGAGPMQKLADGRVSVFGLGGVGSYAAEGLARSGVGHLLLVDFDEVCITNFNRQLHAVEGSVGQSKAALMEARVRAINPRCEVEAPRVFYEKGTSAQLLNPPPDFVVDCIDNVTAKLHLLASCVEGGIPVVTCLGASAKLDPTRVCTASLVDTHTDPLGQAIRKNLRRKYAMSDEDMAKITAVYSDEPLIWPDPDYRSALCGVECICPSGRNPHHTCQKRRVLHGSAVFVTSMFGMVAAAVAVRHLTDLPPIPSRPRLAGKPGSSRTARG